MIEIQEDRLIRGIIQEIKVRKNKLKLKIIKLLIIFLKVKIYS